MCVLHVVERFGKSREKQLCVSEKLKIQIKWDSEHVLEWSRERRVDIIAFLVPVLDTAKTLYCEDWRKVQSCHETGIIISPFLRKQTKVQKFK